MTSIAPSVEPAVQDDISEGGPFTIYVADDEAPNLMLIRRTLQSFDCEIETFTDGRQLLDALGKQPLPDLIVTDGITTFLEADVNFITLTGFGSDGSNNLTSYTLGGLDGGSSIKVTGGTLAPVFDSLGTFSLLLFGLNFAGPTPNLLDPNFVWFPSDFSSDMRFSMQTAPEPGSALLLAIGLIGLATQRRAARA